MQVFTGTAPGIAANVGEAGRATPFFDRIIRLGSCNNVAVLLLTHLLPGRRHFVDALSRIARVAAVIGKPNSISGHELAAIGSRYRVLPIDRRECSEAAVLGPILNDVVHRGEDLVLLDMGGYFSPSL